MRWPKLTHWLVPFDQIFDVNRSTKENGRITGRNDGGKASRGLRKGTLRCLFPGTTTVKRLRSSCFKVDFHYRDIFTRVKFKGVNEIETMHGCSRVDIKVEPRSPFVSAWPFIQCLYFVYASRFYVRLQNWVVTSHHKYGILRSSLRRRRVLKHGTPECRNTGTPEY